MDASYRRKAILAAAAGALLALAMPGVGVGLLAFVGLVPLFVALEEGAGFGAGFAAFVVLLTIDLRWLLTLTRFSPWIAPGYALVVAYLALFGGVFGFLLSRFRRANRFGGSLLLAAPILFTLLEILRAQGPLGLGFSSLYATLYRFPALIQIAAYAGPWAVTAAIVAVNASLYLALRRRPLYAVAGLAVVALLALFAALPVGERGTPLRVGIVASEVPQETKVASEDADALMTLYLAAGADCARSIPDLIVFPESILPDYLLREPRFLEPFKRLAQESEADLLIGTADVREGELYNSVALLTKEAGIAGVYDMARPVPFGQVIPARAFFEAVGLGPMIDPFVPIDITPGRGFQPLEGIGTPICFESTFPGGARAFSRNGADLLVTATNDAWFGRSSELRTHFALSLFRAVENRRFLIQVANGGVSGAVDPRGRILLEFTGAGTSTVGVERRSVPSPYTRWGDLPLLIGCAIGGTTAVALGLRKRRPRSVTGPSGGEDPLAPPSGGNLT